MAARRSRLTLARPRRLRDALRLLRGEPLMPIAGCTDVYVGLQFGTVEATAFLDLWPSMNCAASLPPPAASASAR